VTWLYFFSFKRCRVLKLKKAQEVLGLDALLQAKGKRIDLKGIKGVISKTFPDHKKKGC